MANTSIKEAFARFWEHVIARTGEMINQANKYTDEKIDNLALDNSIASVSITLLASDWTEDDDGLYAQTANVTGVTADTSQVIIVDVQQTGSDIDADIEALGAWIGSNGDGPASMYVTQGDGTLTFHAIATPTINIPIIVGVS